ncbi:glutathione S-transferase family protein [Phaeobacter sp. C3_T13_0]|uniref:glutathione S-transferase family protein n=1 Tax=Phaeobacter cretensis TaxID=3342641 RepID=UPI0039BD0987
MNDFIDEVTPGSPYPQDVFLKALNRLWIDHSYDLLDHIYEIKTALDPVSVEVEKEKLCTKLRALGENLGDRPFFDGDQFSLVDATYAPVFRSINLIDLHFATGILADLPLVKQWAASVLSRSSVRHSILDTYEEMSLAKIAQSRSAIGRRWATQLSE